MKEALAFTDDVMAEFDELALNAGAANSTLEIVTKERRGGVPNNLAYLGDTG